MGREEAPGPGYSPPRCSLGSLLGGSGQAGRIPGRRVEQRIVGGEIGWRWWGKEMGTRKETKENGDGGVIQGSTSERSQKAPGRKGRDCDEGSS